MYARVLYASTHGYFTITTYASFACHGTRRSRSGRYARICACISCYSDNYTANRIITGPGVRVSYEVLFPAFVIRDYCQMQVRKIV